MSETDRFVFVAILCSRNGLESQKYDADNSYVVYDVYTGTLRKVDKQRIVVPQPVMVADDSVMLRVRDTLHKYRVDSMTSQRPSVTLLQSTLFLL
jgi:hypothetical protein